jgi:hypothetical protein
LHYYPGIPVNSWRGKSECKIRKVLIPRQQAN